MTDGGMIASGCWIDLYWLPLGAGARSVRLNGRVYEAAVAAIERRQPFDLYHSALQVRVPGGRFVVEMTPAAVGGTSRGVVGEGAVGARQLSRLQIFRYEIRRWRWGSIPDGDQAVESPNRLTTNAELARRLFDLVPAVPLATWGRDEAGAGEMWNSNSVISWLLVAAGIDAHGVTPPAGGRAPGWQAGLTEGRRYRDERSSGSGPGSDRFRRGGTRLPALDSSADPELGRHRRGGARPVAG
jgi:hypothetical protein